MPALFLTVAAFALINALRLGCQRCIAKPVTHAYRMRPVKPVTAIHIAWAS